MRTLRESLKVMLDEARAGRLGARTEGSGCVYQDVDRPKIHCSMGSLLTPEQQRFAFAHDMNENAGIVTLAKELLLAKLGNPIEDNGLDPITAAAVQGFHDECATDKVLKSVFVNALTNALENADDTLPSVLFAVCRTGAFALRQVRWLKQGEDE